MLELDENIPFFLELYENSLKTARNGFSRQEIKIIIKEVKRKYGTNIKNEYMRQIEFAFLLYLFSFVTWIYAGNQRYSNEIKFESLNIIKYFNKIEKSLSEAYKIAL